MNPIFYVLIPLSICAVILSIHWLLLAYSWKKELKRDEEKRKIVDMLLEVDPEDWANNDFPIHRIN